MTDKQVERHYHRGFVQTRKHRIEGYDALMNDLAEGMYDAERCTMGNLIEALGYASARQTRLIECYNSLQSEATSALCEMMKRSIGERMERLER